MFLIPLGTVFAADFIRFSRADVAATQQLQDLRGAGCRRVGRFGAGGGYGAGPPGPIRGVVGDEGQQGPC